LKLLKKQIWGYGVFDIGFFVASIATIVTISIIFNANWLVILNGILGTITLALVVKAKVITPFVSSIWFIFYFILALQSKLYGEVIIALAISLPTNIAMIILWLKNKSKKDKTVIKLSPKIFKKEWLIFVPCFIVVNIGLAFLLWGLRTEELWLSIASLVLMILANYLLIRRSVWNFFVYLIQDSVTTAIWIVLFIKGDKASLITAIVFLIQMIYDIYGIFEWRKLAKKEKADNEKEKLEALKNKELEEFNINENIENDKDKKINLETSNENNKIIELETKQETEKDITTNEIK
jgi:nicotinamide mononucleotide transporter PnuC